ncbi:MAG TPA: preprotein translocase subunit SecG [Chitinophagaceae bacterium]|nr:preprotein translocase subunit SecG [Chitinophagaceae bacterium]MCC6635078.1 preprotein translocase subunit SecG [Chitinophagaceae bacterium]HMZ46444.1 preprotein translocase subunit SecG [Chitinophagaceae bacterium]HNE93328.1 preprotein translocase subunit SecG [Chitinophagaceae bacterium]HNF29777.1 preprotein translocase subunit SecG [Chitinophagaceae bacterium]
MVLIFVILVVLASVALGFVILVQNPKGGGLSGNIGGIGNQFMGVKQTTDMLEKGTWMFVSIIAVLAIVSSLLFKNVSSDSNLKKQIDKIDTRTPAK